MSRFSKYLIQNYPAFKEDILQGRYAEAISRYVIFYKKSVQTKRKRDYINIQQECSAAFDGFNRHGSRREQNLRALVGNDRAFDAFLDYFRERYGKNGIYRVSTKAQGILLERDYMVFLDKFLKRVIKVSSWDKEKMYKETKWYIHNVIVPQWTRKVVAATHKKLVQRRDNLGVSLYFIKQMEEYRRLTELMEFEDELVKSCFLTYLLWHSVRYINRKIKGNNIPANRLTKLLKKNPLTLEFVDNKEQKALLKTFRLQKNFTSAELDNAHNFYRAVFKNYDDTSMMMEDPEHIANRRPANRDEYIELLSYRKKIISFLHEIRPVIPSDDRRIPAVEEITEHQLPFKFITQQHKAYVDALPSIGSLDTKACSRVLDRLIGIYTFCAREKFMTRKTYYDGYFDSITPTGNKEYWKKWRDRGLELFIFKKEIVPSMQWQKCFYNFNTGKYEEYVSYIEAVQKLYPKTEYIYINVGENLIEQQGDEYITEEGYTLARYDINGELSDVLLEGNYVKPIDNPNYIARNSSDL